ncbi:hypothetical protein LXL04_019076 [Taraxacum kok-saghyz]
MDDFGMLARDFGFRPQGKSAPMKSDSGDFRSRPPPSSSPSPSPFAADDNQIFNDVFGGPPKFTNNTRSTPAMSDIDYDSIFKNSSSTNNSEAKSKSTSSNLPVYDKPVYDDDIFDGLPGMKSKSMHSASARYEENIFASMASSPPKRSQQSDHFDDLLGNLGRAEKVEPPKQKASKSPRGFDDLLPGFGSGGPASSSRSPVISPVSQGTTCLFKNSPTVIVFKADMLHFTSLAVSCDYNEHIDRCICSCFSIYVPLTLYAFEFSQGSAYRSVNLILKMSNSEPVPVSAPKQTSNAMDDPFVVLESASPPVTSSQVPSFIDPLETVHKTNKSRSTKTAASSKGVFDDIDPLHGFGKPAPAFPTDTNHKSKDQSQADKPPVDDFQEPQETVFDMPPVTKPTSPPSYTETSSQEHQSDDIWLTVSEIPLFTLPTKAPPPSRPPPPIPRHTPKGYSGKSTQSHNPFNPTPLDDFDSFGNNGDHMNNEEMDSISNSATAAMKDAMDRAEAKFRHAKEVREREQAKASRNRESVKQREDNEEEEREKNRIEKERIEREKARQAVERATREARERAASGARERASAEARLKSERAAVQRAQAEARERAAIDARERAERAAAEARERANEAAAEKKAGVARAEADAKRRAERAAVERVAAEARERAAVDARDRAAAARMSQQKNENDLDSFFGTGASRPNSAPRPRTTASVSIDIDGVSIIESGGENRRGQEGGQRTWNSSAGVSSNMKKASSSTNIVDDLSSIFGAAPSSSGMFQDVEGETEERRRARLERQQRTQERAAKALAEKNNRDLQTQRDQEEKNRLSETLDIEIKRWAAGKEGNLRALLSTLQYVLWPGCGWQPVSLTDLITGANVKKAYRKATLCIHPDKVQQKGANIQQKYVAEKVFDLLKYLPVSTSTRVYKMKKEIRSPKIAIDSWANNVIT